VDRIGRYRLGAVLGEGATGVVYRASDGEREVAVKILRDRDAVAQRRFEREARLAGESESRHLVHVLEVGDDYIVMPLYTGGTLADRLGAVRRLTLDDTIELVAQLGRGLDALHERGIVHRDVKPSNVLLDGDGVAALADFGLARGADSTQLTQDGQLLGTAHYLAPELIEGKGASRASDIYALGCVVYECLVGEPPFTGRGPAEIGFAHLFEAPPDPRERRPELPADLTLGLLTLLEKDPSLRPTSGAAAARMLHLARSSSPR
jgi:eukaryotic-like serine/threonine-protein kinase